MYSPPQFCRLLVWTVRQRVRDCSAGCRKYFLCRRYEGRVEALSRPLLLRVALELVVYRLAGRPIDRDWLCDGLHHYLWYLRRRSLCTYLRRSTHHWHTAPYILLHCRYLPSTYPLTFPSSHSSYHTDQPLHTPIYPAFLRHRTVRRSINPSIRPASSQADLEQLDCP